MSQRPPGPRGRILFIVAGLLSAATALPTAALAQQREQIVMDVHWTDERCDFVVTRDSAGYGVAMRLTPLTLKAGDVLVGPLNAVGAGGKVAKQGTSEAAMMQVRKYGIRRALAYDLIFEWSRYCNPPEE
jgi:hypothetical protein